MRRPLPNTLICSLLLVVASTSASAVSFVYEGRLDDRNRPASGRYDLRLTVASGPTDPVPLAVLTFPATEVIDGRFRLPFDVPGLHAAEPWVGLAVRATGEATFSEIPGRSKASAGIAQCWGTTGDAGTNPFVNFLGTTDNAALVLRANNARALRLVPSPVLFAGAPNTANVLAGSYANDVAEGVRGATIAGGGLPEGDSEPDFEGEAPNRVFDDFGTVSGGVGNQAGLLTTNPRDAVFATVGGGFLNSARAAYAFVGGGFNNSVNISQGVVAGGVSNVAGQAAAVGGGVNNVAIGFRSAVSGGSGNTARGAYSAVAGGDLNCAGADYSFAGGRRAKVRAPSGAGSLGLGCDSVPAGGGAGDTGTFVWADSQNADFVSEGNDQFLVRARGGAAFNLSFIPSGIDLLLGNSGVVPNANVDLFLRSSTNPRGINLRMLPGLVGNSAEFRISQYDGGSTFTDRLMVRANGDFEVTANALKPGGGSWAMSSDARLKHHVTPLAGTLERLLSLRGVSFEYLTPDPAKRPPGVQVGFVAQEVQQVFPDWVGADSEGYLTVASRGFEALTVEALRELRGESATIDGKQDARIDHLEALNARLTADNQALRAESEVLLRRIEQIEARMAARGGIAR